MRCCGTAVCWIRSKLLSDKERKAMRLFFMMGLLVTLHSAHADELYRWVDKDGKVHYGDTPVEDAEKLKFSTPDTTAASGIDDANLPYAARQARKNFPVTLYVSE